MILSAHICVPELRTICPWLLYNLDMVEFKIVDDVVPYLDLADKVNCNVYYNRQNFEKYIG